MTCWGYDISNWQGYNFDHRRAKREGFDFGIFKSSEGIDFTDGTFAGNLDRGRDAGVMCAAYHYLRPGSAQAQVNLVKRIVPRDCPVIPDVEAGSGGVPHVREFVDRLRDAGYTVPLLYLPRWYWNQLGNPSMAGLPPLWYSVYANYDGGTASAIWNRNSGWFMSKWVGYGGLDVEIMQFTSSATVARSKPIDANRYEGSRDELAALLDSQNTEEDDMPSAEEVADAVVSRLMTNNVTDEDSRLDTLLRYAHSHAYHAHQNGYAALRALKDMSEGQPVEVDADAIVAGVLAGMAPAKLADAIKDNLGAEVAREVVDALGARLHGERQ